MALAKSCSSLVVRNPPSPELIILSDWHEYAATYGMRSGNTQKVNGPPGIGGRHHDGHKKRRVLNQKPHKPWYQLFYVTHFVPEMSSLMISSPSPCHIVRRVHCQDGKNEKIVHWIQPKYSQNVLTGGYFKIATNSVCEISQVVESPQATLACGSSAAHRATFA